jgi:glutamate formiminotransferase/formiminotetrahydrofolate cyclodeaminase
MSAIVECVPNFSEGRDPALIAQITAAIEAVEGVTLLDVDPGEATNRTVVTMVGSPQAVVEAAFQGMAKAQELIDMAGHSGAHPRMGATDVCPFVPVRDITMEECAELARTLGARVGKELGIPVYLYESAASSPERENLATVRAGEYEGLSAKLADKAWAPDFGPAKWSKGVAASGATAIGARPFLIAYNVNLNTKHKKKAMKIAALVREKGIIRRDGNNEIVRDDEGKVVRDPGLFKHVKAIGWFIDEYDCCQVSINFTNHIETPIHQVVDTIRRVADKEGVIVTGSELVGLIPEDALIDAGHHYLMRQGLNPGAPKAQLIETAIRSLGLRDLGPFDPNERIIERRIERDGKLVSLSLRDFTDLLSSSAPAPGGGSVAALCGAMSAGLTSMVGSLTTGKEGHENLWEIMDSMAVHAQNLREDFLTDVDADTEAFNGIMAAFALPKGSPKEKKARGKAVQAATREAIEVPLRVLERSEDVLSCIEAAVAGNPNARSDAGVSALLCWACAEGAWYNVHINLDSFKDAAAGQAYRVRADTALETVTERVLALTDRVRAELI